jgi:hypothetical protein
MAKYAIPAEVVFTFDDEPVDIQEMLHDNAESEEVVEGLERLLKAVAAPGFTEAEVVFDIGGGISVVRAARRTANPRKYVTNAEAAHLFGVSTDALGDSAKVGQTVTIETRYPNKAKNYTRTITKVTKRYLTVTDGTRYLRDTLEEDTSGSTWGIPGSAIVKIGGIRVDNPGDDGQQSLPLFDRTGNPHGGGLVSGYGINTFAMDPDDYAPERQSNPRESIATMLGRPRR